MDYQSFAKTYIDDRLLKAKNMRQLREINKSKITDHKGLREYWMMFVFQLGLISEF